MRIFISGSGGVPPYNHSISREREFCRERKEESRVGRATLERLEERTEDTAHVLITAYVR